MQIVYKRYPCGLEESITNISLIGIIFSYIGLDDNTGCPIHGKECYQSSSKNNSHKKQKTFIGYNPIRK